MTLIMYMYMYMYITASHHYEPPSHSTFSRLLGCGFHRSLTVGEHHHPPAWRATPKRITGAPATAAACSWRAFCDDRRSGEGGLAHLLLATSE